MAQQLVTRVSDELAARVDELVESGAFASRSDAVRAGLEAVADEQRRLAIGKKIVDGYRQNPQSDDEGLWSDAASAAMIADEPW